MKPAIFKFGKHLEFAKANQQIPLEEKVGGKSWGLPFNISATAEASDFKFGVQLGFAKDHHKITRRRKWVVALD